MTPDYTPSNGENAANAAVLTLTASDPDGAGPCPSVSDVLNIVLNDTVQVSAGADEIICSNTSITLNGTISGSATSSTWTTAGDGSFDDETDLNAVYTPGPGDILAGSIVLTLTTDDPVGPCLSNSDDMTLDFSDPATLLVNTPVVSCIGETVPLTSTMGGTGTVITWSNGGGVFSDINSETPIYTPSTPEEDANFVSLTVTVTDPDGAGPCLDVVETVEITINDTVEVSAGADEFICSDATITLSGTIDGGASSATWTTTVSYTHLTLPTILLV